MALAFGAAVLDGTYTKIFTVTCLDNDAAANLAVDFTTEGMTDLPSAPVDYYWVKTTSTDQATDFAITAVAATGLTIRKLTAAGAGGGVTVRITARVIHSIDR